jgi:hypothetical protein
MIAKNVPNIHMYQTDMTFTLEANSVKPTADVLNRRKEWAIDGARAWDEYLAAPAVAAAKSARLRQERLEKAAADNVAAQKAASEKAASKHERLKSKVESGEGLKKKNRGKRTQDQTHPDEEFGALNSAL